jgi:hypothetical protein
LCSVFVTFAHAEKAGHEIQFGAFLIQENAEKLKADLKETIPDLYISPIRSGDGRLLFSVRTGPFQTMEEAEKRLAVLPQMEDLEPAMVLAKGSFLKDAGPDLQGESTVSEEIESGETAPVISKAQEPGTSETTVVEADESSAQTNETKALNDGDGGLWGGTVEDAWESDETISPGEEEPATSHELQALEEEIETLKGQMKSLLDAEEIRGELTESTDEKENRDDEILDAAGRNYTLMTKGGFGFEYKLDYTYFAYDTITEINVIEHNSNHTIINTFTIEYPMQDNLTLEAAIPFVYEYDAVGRSDSKHVTDFGDVRFGMSYQPIKSGGKIPSVILNTALTCPMGRSPYEVNPELDLSTGSGGYSVEGSVSLSKAIDPIMAFGTLSYDYRFPIKDIDHKIGSYTMDRYDRGDSLGVSVGLGYSVSYITSVTLGYSYSYSFKSKRYYKEGLVQEYPTQTSSSLSIGSSWRLSKKLRVNATLQIGLGNSEYFSLSFRLPMEFGRD